MPDTPRAIKKRTMSLGVVWLQYVDGPKPKSLPCCIITHTTNA